MMNLLVSIGHGPSSTVPETQPPDTQARFRDSVRELLNARGKVMAEIQGQSTSAWGEEPGTWFSGILHPAEWVTVQQALYALAVRYGQDAIYVSVGGDDRTVEVEDL